MEEEIKESLLKLRALQAELMALADKDAEAFAPFAAAYGMPAETEEQKEEKARVMEENLLAASLVPLEIMKKTSALLDVLEIM